MGGAASRSNREGHVTSEIENLNAAFIRQDDGYADLYGELQDYSTLGVDAKTQVFFRNLEDHLIEYIDSSDIVLGCVAWFTNEKILQALAKKEGVSFIVQKEDFLKPDIGTTSNWKKHLHQLYSNLPRSLDRRDFHWTVLGLLQCNPDSLIDPVRCVGNYNRTKQPAFPRSHHKFAIFCRYIKNCCCKTCLKIKKDRSETFNDGTPMYYHCIKCLHEGNKSEKSHIQPYAVWTGSFNFTKNACVSFENAVILKDPKISYAFYKEYTQIAAISEPLDWSAQWINPEWAIQTIT